MATYSSFKFTCSVTNGWRNAEGPEVTERGKKFLPVLLEFLRRSPVLDGPIGIVQQTRLFPTENRDLKIGTLLCLQRLQRNVVLEGSTSCQLVCPAVYAETMWTDERKEKEKEFLKAYLGKDAPDHGPLFDELEKRSWCYDIVLRLHMVDVRCDSVLDDSAMLVVEWEAVPPSIATGKAVAEGFSVWDPAGVRGGDEVLRFCLCLPWHPPSTRLANDDRCVVYVVDAKHIDVLTNLNSVWQSRAARNVLLAGPPGCGKDVAARLIHHGRGRGRFCATSSKQPWELYQVQLLGQGQPLGPPLFRGCIEDARGGTVFIDEIDKADADVRSGLLRVIESDEFGRPGSGKQIRLREGTRPLFLFAGSGNGETARKMNEDERRQTTVVERIRLEDPPDFWSRIDKTIDLYSPFEISKGTWDETIIHRYVQLFMLRVRERHRRQIVTPYVTSTLLRIADDAVEKAVTDTWHLAAKAMSDALLTHINAKKRADMRFVRAKSERLAELLAEHGQSRTLPGDFSELIGKVITEPQ